MFHEMTLKLYFMKSSERNISQCILPFNDSSIGVFIDYIGDDLKQQLSSETVKTKFYVVLCDGSIDANTIENKVKCKL